MLPVNEMLLVVSSSLPASIVVKATVVTTAALVSAQLGRRCRASVRHAWLASAVGVLLFLPIAAVVERPVPITLTTAAPTARAVRMSEVTANPAPTHDDFPVETAATGSSPVAPSSSLWSTWLLSTWLVMGWVAGTVLFLIPIALGLRQLRFLRRTSVPWGHGQTVADAAARNAIGRSAEVLLHESLRSPMTCGVIRPIIVLPMDAPQWSVEELNRAIVHELEHVRRGDWISHCVARLLCALYWFQPLVWTLSRRLALEAERACDDAVLRDSDAPAYADQLVALAQRLSAGRNSAAIAMASRADLKARVRALLDSGQQRGRAGAMSVSFTFAAGVALVLTLSPLRMVAAPQTPSPAIATPSPAPPVLVAQAVPRPQTRPTPAQQTETSPVTFPAPQFRSSTKLVIADLVVKDQDGRMLEGLSAGDFTVNEDGKTQAISVFEFQSLKEPGPSSYYIVGYYSTNDRQDGAYRKINIALRNNSAAKLDYRAGYYGNKLFENFTAPDQDAPNPGAMTTVGPATNLAIGAPPTLAGPTLALGTMPPSLLMRVDPAYSEEARRAKYSGTVTLELEVGADGHPTDIRVARSLGMGLDEQAVAALQRWKFTPAVQNGQPVAARVQVVMSFRLL